MARSRKNGGIIGKRRETKAFSKSGVWTQEDVNSNVPYYTKDVSDVAGSPTGWTNTTDTDPYYNMVVYHMADADYTDNVAKDKSINYWDESLSPDQYWKLQHSVYSGPRYRDWSTFFGEGGYYQVADKADMRFGTGNFTIEFWFKPARKDATEYYIMGKGANAGRTSGTGWVVYVSTTYNIGFYDAVGNTSYQASGTLATDQWYHVAIVRSSTGANGLTVYVNGSQQVQGTCASNFTDTSVMYIGRDRVATGTTWCSGWITDIRLANISKYGSPFTAPTAALDMSTSDVVFSHSMLKPHHDNIPQKHAQFAVITFPGSTLQRMIDTPFVNNATRLTGHGSHSVHLYDGGRSQKIYDNKSFTITATTANVLTVSTTMGLTTGQPILLSGTPFGSLTATQFYVGNVLSTTTMTISSTAGGADFATGASATGSMTATNNSLRLGTGAFTVEGWFYFTNNTLTNGLVGKGTGNYGSGTGWSLLIDGSGWLQWADVSTTLIGNATGNTGYWTGWYHVAVVRESTATNKFKMYMNGALQYMGTVSTDYNITDDLRIWGTRNDQYTLRGSVCGLRISRVARYNADFIVPTSLLQPVQTGSTTGNIATISNTAATSLLLNSINSGAYITDSSNTPVTITATGSPTWSSQTPFAGNVAGSIQFNGTSQYLTAATSSVFAVGTGAFTVEAWIYVTSLAAINTIIDFRSAAGNSAFFLSVLTTGALRFFDGPATGTARDTPTGVITANTWYHVVATRVNSVLRLFVNGILHYYFPGNTSDYGATTQPITIGRSADSAAYNYFVGYITGLRVVKGLSVYTSSFDVESTAFIDSSMSTDYNTSILLATTGNNAPYTNTLQYVDYGSERNVIWRYSNEIRFGHSHPYSRHGHSFFNYASNASHLHVVDSGSNFNFGSNDFSIEFWTNQTYGHDTFSTYRYLYDSRVYFNDTGLGIRINAYMKIDVVTNNVPILKDTSVYLRHRHWTHIVVQRVNGNIALYIDGRRRCETRYTGTINAPGNKLFIGNGAYPNIQYNSPNYGHIADIRILNGTGAYSSGQTFTTARSVLNNVITVDSTANFVVGRPVVFKGTAIANIVSGTTYYVLSIVDSTSFTISSTQGGSVFVAGATGSGTMNVKVGVGTNPEFIRMPTEPTTATPYTVLLTCGASPIFKDFSGANNTVQAGGRNEANFASNSVWDVYMTNFTPYSGKDFDNTKHMAGQTYDSNDGYNFRSIGFQGDSTYPELSYITRMTKAWTVEFWCYGHNVTPATPSNQGYWRTATSAGHEGWDFYAHYNGTANSWGDLMFRKWRAADSTSEYISTTGGTGNYSPHSWNHIVIQYDPLATNKVAMFCNGNRVATRAAFTAGTKSWNTYVLSNGNTGIGPVRISDIARYANDNTTYTIPTQMWPVDANAVVLSNAYGPFYPKSSAACILQYGTGVSYQYKKFGNGSMYFSNKETTLSERVYMACNYWNSQSMSVRRGDWTIECWACWKDAASGGVAPNGTAGNVLWHLHNHIWVGINPTGYWKFEQATGGGTAPTYYQRYADTVTPAATAASGRFDHVVVVRRSGDYYFYVNGVEKYIMLQGYWGSYTAGQGPTTNFDVDLYDSYMLIGTDNNNDTNTDWSGYVQDFRMTLFARYETRVINNIPTMVHAQTEIPALPTKLFPTK